MTDNAAFLAETQFFNYSHPSVQALVDKVQASTITEQVIELYYLIRDSIKYNPYTFAQGEEAFYASYAAEQDEAYCIPKSALMVAACRSLGIPAKLGLADVRNHLSSKKLLDWLGTDLFVMHGYAEVFVEGKWVKCTPVFNLALCQKFGVKPLEFDAKEDSIFHPYTENGQPHMEYVKDHGTFAELPAAMIIRAAKDTYPHVELISNGRITQSLEADLAT